MEAPPPGSPPALSAAVVPAAAEAEQEPPGERRDPGPPLATIEGRAGRLYQPAGLPVEAARQWEHARSLLPKDFAGGVDWVSAVRTGAVAPRPHANGSAVERPFTLGTIVQGLAVDDRPPFDFNVRFKPTNLEFFEVVFPHASHTLWLNCSSCHPGIVGTRVRMEQIFDGEHCGKCHGKVAFAPETACARCHVKLQPPSADVLAREMAEAEANPVDPTADVLRWGKLFYGQLCAMCHGEEGDGAGPFAHRLVPRPRDFRDGMFKFRTTPSGSLPTDLDLFRTITTGLKGTGMPAWGGLTARDRWSLVHYIKGFSEIFEEEEPDDPVDLPPAPPPDKHPLADGERVYDESKCWDCHGMEGAADGPSADQLEDDWGQPIRPADFTSDVLRAGATVEEVFRTISTGLDGTPMPSYGDVLTVEERWSLAYYVRHLAEQETGHGLAGDIHFSRYSREVGELPPATFPHWYHRIRFRCSACHEGIFRMKAGANNITMDKIRAGEFCARCHDGETAWYVGFETCRRCHRPN